MLKSSLLFKKSIGIIVSIIAIYAAQVYVRISQSMYQTNNGECTTFYCASGSLSWVLVDTQIQREF